MRYIKFSFQILLFFLSISPLLSYESVSVDYKNHCTELCLIGAHYDTDKSSQRKNDSYLVYCHPYTIFYDALFKHLRSENLHLAEIGIYRGASLLMWQDYFPHAKIAGFEFDDSFIHSFKTNPQANKIALYKIDVTNSENITHAFQSTGVLYDIIVDDATHQMNDQINVIKSVHPFLKPGGVLIVEDIFMKYREQDYLDKLGSTLDSFSMCLFISMNHINRYSPGWDNDKLLVLVKSGGEPLIKIQDLLLHLQEFQTTSPAKPLE